MLIATLPPVSQTNKIIAIVHHPMVDAVRLNSATPTSLAPEEVLKQMLAITQPAGKPLYVDLHGKQLRTKAWANLSHDMIALNHDADVTLPATIHIGGHGERTIEKITQGNLVHLQPTTQEPTPINFGRPVNILAENVDIKGVLVQEDYEYIEAALNLGIRRFMLSFVEDWGDVAELIDAITQNGVDPVHDCEIVFKIESHKGVAFVANDCEPGDFHPDGPYRLLAARSDMVTQIGVLDALEALQVMIERDPRTICAARLLTGLLSEQNEPSLADVSDVALMSSLGYEHFMFPDDLSHHRGIPALDFWQEIETAWNPQAGVAA